MRHQALHIAGDLVQRVVGWRGCTVADVPVLYFVDPGGVAFLQIRFMLGFLQSNNMISSLKITLLDLQGKALGPRVI